MALDIRPCFQLSMEEEDVQVVKQRRRGKALELTFLPSLLLHSSSIVVAFLGESLVIFKNILTSFITSLTFIYSRLSLCSLPNLNSARLVQLPLRPFSALPSPCSPSKDSSCSRFRRQEYGTDRSSAECSSVLWVLRSKDVARVRTKEEVSQLAGFAEDARTTG